MYQQGTSRSLSSHIVNPGININYCCVCSNCHLDCLKEIYPSQLTVEKANKSDHLADYFDLTFIIDSGGNLSTRLYDKRDDFDLHIVNLPFHSSNILSGHSYGVYISQLIRYARCCSHNDDFRYRHKHLVD